MGRVLSIQSHVIHGYVGNKSAVFPLQLLGFDVDPVNSVQFSNHTGYPMWTGEVLQGSQLLKLVDGLEGNGLLGGYTHLLTGYTGCSSFLTAVVQVARKLKAINPTLQYVCDPVLGDDGRCYVPEALVEQYRTEVLPLADVLTPNQFEAEMLSGIKITSEADAQRACLRLHAHGPRTVVITSASFGGNDRLYVLASSRSGRGMDSWKTLQMCKLVIPKFPGSYTGTGDLTAALLLAWLDRLPNDLPAALERVIATLQATIGRTHELGGAGAELRLVQSKHDIERPEVHIRSAPIFSRVQGVIFDMDGTLTAPGLINFARIRETLGISADEDILTSVERLPSADERARALAVIEAEELKGFDPVRLSEGAVEVVMWLRTRGVHVAIATRNHLACVEVLQGCSQWPDGAFHPVLTRVRKSEEDVHLVLGVCRGWDVQPASVLVVGDSLEDMEWGFRAGCRTCLVDAGAPHTPSTLNSGFTHYCIETLHELSELLETELSSSQPDEV